MKQDSTTFLKFVKYSGITVGALMVSGIVALMVISRGKGEDITGIVAPALLLTFVSSIVAIVAAVLQKRSQKAIDLKSESDPEQQGRLL
jgi:spore maturation protein SpmA